MLREHSAAAGAVARLVRDYRAGVICDWPDAFTAAASDAVYLVLEHVDSATEARDARDALLRSRR